MKATVQCSALFIMAIIMFAVDIYGASKDKQKPQMIVSEIDCMTSLSRRKKLFDVALVYEKDQSLTSRGNADESTMVSTLMADAAQIVSEKRGDDWIKRALSKYLQILEMEPDNLKAQWGVASLLEYSGNYERAVPYYEWVEKAEDADENLKAEARTHIITCKFLAMQTDGSDDQEIAESVRRKRIDLASVDFSDASIKERSGWNFLSDLAATTLVVGGVSGLGGKEKHLDVALELLDEWILAPTGSTVEARNRFLAGMVGVITSIILENKLEKDINVKLAEKGYRSIESWPSKRYAGKMEWDFAVLEPGEGRMYDLSRSYRTADHRKFHQIAGDYECESGYGCVPVGTHTKMEEGIAVTETVYPLSVRQSGNSIQISNKQEITYPPCTRGEASVSGCRSVIETRGEGRIVDNKVDLTMHVVISTSGQSATYYGSTHSTPPQNYRSTYQVTLYIMQNGRLEFVSKEGRSTWRKLR